MAVTFDLGNVQGPQGVPGIPGAKGDPGERGEQGIPGQNGADGVSPVITGNKVGKATTLTIVDAESPQGRTLATILDGADGDGSGDMRAAAYDPQGAVLAEGGIPAYVEAHATQEEADPVFTASPAHDITAEQITEWDGLQGQIDAITSQSDVIDVVATKAALIAYTEPVYKGDIVKVLADESNGGAIAYYRVGGSVEPPAQPEPPYTWVCIGAQGPYYTKNETNTLLATKQPTINASGILKGDGSGNVSAAVAGTDYATPAQVDGKVSKTGDTMTGPLTIDASGAKLWLKGTAYPGTIFKSTADENRLGLFEWNGTTLCFFNRSNANDPYNQSIFSLRPETYDLSELAVLQTKISDTTKRYRLFGEHYKPHTAQTVTLTVADWSNNQQTVSAAGVTASNTVIVSPAPASVAAYGDAGIYASAQGNGTLTFTCTSVPSSAVTVNVVVLL